MFTCPACGYQTEDSRSRTCPACGHNGDWIQPSTRRHIAKESDCADCGQSDAEFKFRGEDSICVGCAPQYQSEDLTPS